MNTLLALTVALAVSYLIICAGWWLVFWWDATDAEEEGQALRRWLPIAGANAKIAARLGPAWLERHAAAMKRATYARAQMARFYQAPWLIATGQARRHPTKHGKN